ncbi:MAG: FG-GAP repeat protein [Ignavibacteria bacterium]|nr:FG-GAP repeat protein [Ignavibacteria bacterium]
MKTYLFLFLIINSSLCSQTYFNQSYRKQPDRNKSYPNEFLYTSVNKNINYYETDSLIIMDGDSINANFGASVSNAGDVNGDGYDDVITGASGNGGVTGKVYIFYGGLIMDNLPDVLITGTGNYFGNTVSAAGDVNGDSYSDVIIGDEYYNGASGRSCIYYGGASMNNVADVILTGEAGNNNFGGSVSNAGDVNGDGYSDVIVGAWQYDLNTFYNIGRAYIYYGGDNMDNISDVTMTGEVSGSVFGQSVSSAGDVNADGYSDVIVGASLYGGNIGKAYVFYGGISMNNAADVIMSGTFGDNLGSSVSSAGDVNGDGYSDVITGAIGFNAFKGRSYIFYGGDPMNNFADVTMSGEEMYNYFGCSVSSAGDINNDGYSDVIVGASGGNSSIYGHAYIYFGSDSMNNIADLKMTGETAGDMFGKSVSEAGDINSDGFPDVLAGASGYGNNTGRAYLYKTNSFLRIKLKLLMEGMYFPVFNQMSRKDTVKVYLRNAALPYEIIDSAKGIIDSLNFSNIFTFYNAPAGIYYLVVKHFNCIETWSKSGGEAITINGLFYNYDFTSSISQAFGNNLKLKSGKYCIYSGDLNQDEIIDASDLSEVDNASYEGLSGRYLNSDVNGNGYVDATDVSIVDNNRSVILISP